MQNRKHTIRFGLGLLLLLLLIAIIPGSISTGNVQGTALAAGQEWRDVVVIYASDCKGKIEPCG